MKSPLYILLYLFSSTLVLAPAGAQTSLVRELCEANYFDYSTGLGYFMGFNDHLYFSRVDFCFSSGIVRTDGTAAGTNKISGASFEWHPTARCISGGHLYYGGGNWLRRINGVTGDDESVKEGLWHPRHMADLNGILIFSQNGTGLWRSDGTADGTYQIRDIEGIAEIHSDGSYAYIGANHGIWRTNGTDTELLLPNTLAPDGTTINFYQRSITAWNGEIYFIHVGSGPDASGYNVEFFNLAKWSDGQVTFLTSFDGASEGKNDFSLINRFFPTENGLYFVGRTFQDGVLRHNQLWKTNGTAGGTYKVAQLSGESAIPEYFHLNTTIPPKNVRNIFFFPVGTNTSATELWRSDGTSAGTFPVKTGISSPRDFGMVDNVCYFIAYDSIHGSEVWRSDGTASGTYMIEDLYPGPGSGAAGANYANMEINASAFKGRYYFVGYTPETGNELFATGGTDPETIRARFTDNLGWCAHCESDVFRIAGAGPNHQYMIYTSGDALTSSGEKFSLHWDGSRWIGQHETKNPGSGGEWVPGETSTSNGLHTSPKPPCTGWNNGFSLIKGCMTPVLGINVPPGAPTINTSAVRTAGTIDGKNAYELPLTDGPQNQKITVSWNAALSRWEMVLEDPSARVSAGTLLSYNAEDSGANPPCTGWSGGYGFSGDICISGTLPVTLTSFEAIPDEDRSVRLTWQTASEENFQFFGVERSPDARNFEEIARIAATKAGQEHKSYIHIDSNPLAGRNYYRLRLVDLTGESELSRLISVEMPEITAPYPNPAKEGVFFIDTNSLKTLRLHDMMGRNIPYSTKPLGGDIVEIHPGQQLMPGIYFIFVNGKRHKMLVE